MKAVGLHRKGEISLETIIAEVKRNPDAKRAGALASFTGIVREDPIKTSAGKVRFLQYEAYEEPAMRKLEEIRADLLRREGIVDVWIHHVVDNLAVGDESLFVVVLGDHRQHAFTVLGEAVERVKNEVPIWKKEVAESDAYWVSGH